MRVYLQPPQPSRGLDRIAQALARYAPSTVEVVPYQSTAVGLTVIYAIGRREHIQRQVEDILARDRQYAIVQVCLRSTMSPNACDWSWIWHRAQVVWSYYDLRKALFDDGEGHDDTCINHYHAPLGVDAEVFQPNSQAEKQFVVATSGNNRLQESIRECVLAAQQLGRKVFHVGGKRRWYGVDTMTYSDHCNDHTLAGLYSACEFVSGLRRTEGFELPAAEGLLCGARPIVFDTPDYRWNYREFAEYIHEGTRAEVVDQLVQLFKQGTRPVGAAELNEARHWFNWERVCGEFWQRCLG